jgi:hypothetical protein
MLQFYMLFDEELVPCDMMEWAVWNSENSPTIDLTVLNEGAFQISTVFLGFGHGVNGVELFETMVFDVNGKSVLQHRYRTLAEAKAGHKQVITSLMCKIDRALREEQGEILPHR